MTELQIFENPAFGEVRTIEEDGKVLFCGKDIAAALGYSNTQDALSRHCKGVVKHDPPFLQEFFLKKVLTYCTLIIIIYFRECRK